VQPAGGFGSAAPHLAASWAGLQLPVAPATSTMMMVTMPGDAQLAAGGAGQSMQAILPWDGGVPAAPPPPGGYGYGFNASAGAPFAAQPPLPPAQYPMRHPPPPAVGWNLDEQTLQQVAAAQADARAVQRAQPGGRSSQQAAAAAAAVRPEVVKWSKSWVGDFGHLDRVDNPPVPRLVG
jgi:hypothetical protein